MATALCRDTAGWTNPYGDGCARFVSDGHCGDGGFRAGHEWARGAGFGHPENHCCACGKPAGLRLTRENNPWAHAPHNPCYDPSNAGVPFGKEFCPRWPSYGSSHNMSASVASRLERAARRSLRPFRRGISRAQLEAALEPRCAQRLCVGVQIVNRELFVIAPRSQACGVRPSKTSSTVNYEPACRSDKRRVTPGVYGRWMSGWNPTSLVWHWLAGMNVSDCRVGVMYGDWNGPYTRQRFVTALRLLEEAARHGAPDVELVLCANEVPLNAGGWCLSGPQPIFAPTTNEQHPLIAFPHWMPKLRDYDFSVWDAARAVQRERADAVARATPDLRKGVAVFRGGIYRLVTYSDEWRSRGVNRTVVTPSNFRRMFRTALLSHASDELVDVNLRHGGPADNLNKYGRWVKELGIGEAEMAALDQPEKLGMAAQQAGFRYVLNVEGHGGWADRLYQLLLSPMLVIAQDLPSRLWYEGVLTPGVTHLAVDSNLRNVSEAVRWANAHPAEVRAMVAAANEAMEAATSVAGIRVYVRALLDEYAKLLRAPSDASAAARHPRAVRFRCARTDECHRCRRPEDGTPSQICGTKCAFVGPASGKEHATLHAAAAELKT